MKISNPNLLKSSTRNSSEEKFVMEDIQKALQSLPEQYRIPFMPYFEGYKYQEIAKERKLPHGTVKTYIHQARQMLNAYLKQYRPA